MTDAPYPRADPAGAEYLPADVWDAAQLPVGVRLELAGNARTIRVWYKTTRASLGYRGESAGCSFVAYRGGQKVAAVEAVMGEGMAELVMSGRTDQPVTVYLPEGMVPLITGVAGVEETMTPAPLQPRWLAYGDAVTQGWLASAPAMAWPAVAGRKLGLDVCNLGYAGTARGETTSALLLAETSAEAISIAFGLNNWSRVPHTAGLMAEEVRCFLSVVRQGHPDIPIVVVSPTARPEAEDTPNRVGATLAQLRTAMEETVLDAIAAGDEMLYLVEGRSVVDPEDLEDGMYPGDEGHRRLAAAVAKLLLPHLTDLHDRAEKRWASEGIPATPDVSDIDVPPVVTPPVTATSPATTAAPPDPATDGGADASLRFDQDLDPGDQVAFSEPATLPDRDGRPDMASLEQALLHHPPLNDATVATETGPTTVEDAAPEQCAVDASPIDLDVLDPAPVDVAVPVEPEPVDTAPTHVAGETDLGAPPEGGTPAGDVTTDGGAAPSVVAAEPPPLGDAKTTVRRDMTPVDIEIADMVVAALTLATNGADDVFGHGDPVDELQWGQAVPTYELRWPEGTEPAADEDRQWAEAVATDEFEWADPSATDEFEWADPGAVEELQWAETADPGAY